MSKNQSNPEGNAQQTDPNSRGPFDDKLRKRPRTIPGNVLSLNLSDYSDDELAEMYESSRQSYTKKEIQRARRSSLEDRVSDDSFLRYNRARGGPVRPEEVNLASTSDETPPSLPDYDLRQVITDGFGKEGWSVMKPLLAIHATLLLDDTESSRAMMIEGQSGVGKTMLLKTFGGVSGQFCRRSNVTPASFVSAGSSNSNSNSTNNDLLPSLDDRTLAVRDAQTFFTGSEQSINSRWSTLARVMDGDGYYRQTATGGKTGYDDIRFNFIGATTPLSPRAWRMMGNVGQRLLFVEWPDEDYDGVWLPSVVDGGERQPIERGRDAVQRFLRDLWDYHGGAESVAWTDDPISQDVGAPLQRLARVVAHARGSLQDGRANIEAPKRIGKLLHDLARGHALIHGRTHLELEDVEVCGRVALSTMPAKRRGIVRALLDPDRDDPLTAGHVETILDVSRPTARDRINEVAALGMGEVVEETGRGGTTKAIEVNSEFRWPDGVPFPEF